MYMHACTLDWHRDGDDSARLDFFSRLRFPVWPQRSWWMTFVTDRMKTTKKKKKRGKRRKEQEWTLSLSLSLFLCFSVSLSIPCSRVANIIMKVYESPSPAQSVDEYNTMSKALFLWKKNSAHCSCLFACLFQNQKNKVELDSLTCINSSMESIVIALKNLR